MVEKQIAVNGELMCELWSNMDWGSGLAARVVGRRDSGKPVGARAGKLNSQVQIHGITVHLIHDPSNSSDLIMLLLLTSSVVHRKPHNSRSPSAISNYRHSSFKKLRRSADSRQ